MKNTLRKTIASLLMLSMLVMLPACGPTPTPSDDAANGIKLSELGKYTIVYPASYEEWQMEEVTLIQKAVKHVTGSDISAVPDTEAEKDNEIIFASSNRQTSLSEQINALANDMDYIVAESNGDIILGGKSYYGDMRAAYDFVNNYLGYNDLDDIYGDAAQTISGTSTNTYKEPAFTIMVANPGKYPFSCANDVKVMADAGFNMVKLDSYKISTEDFRSYAKWCARFGVRIVLKSVYNIKEKTFDSTNLDVALSCPMMRGHHARYEEATYAYELYSEMCDVYKETYSKYGWKLVMKLESETDTEPFNAILENKGIFKNADIICISNDALNNVFGGYYTRSYERLDILNKLKTIATRNNNELWMAVTTSTATMSSDMAKAPNAFRWNAYIALGYGVTGIEYSLYKRGNVINDNYTKGTRYDDIKAINDELLKMSEIYTQYESLGIYTVDQSGENDPFYNINEPYTGFGNVITEFISSPGYSSPTLFGCFKSKTEDNKYAFVAVNLDSLTELSVIYPPSSFKLNGETVTLYDNGDATVQTLAKTGYYVISISNGAGVFVTIEQ